MTPPWCHTDVHADQPSRRGAPAAAPDGCGGGWSGSAGPRRPPGRRPLNRPRGSCSSRCFRTRRVRSRVTSPRDRWTCVCEGATSSSSSPSPLPTRWCHRRHQPRKSPRSGRRGRSHESHHAPAAGFVKARAKPRRRPPASPSTPGSSGRSARRWSRAARRHRPMATRTRGGFDERARRDPDRPGRDRGDRVRGRVGRRLAQQSQPVGRSRRGRGGQREPRR